VAHFEVEEIIIIIIVVVVVVVVFVVVVVIILLALQPTMGFTLLSDSPTFRPFVAQLSPPSYSHHLYIFFNIFNPSFPWCTSDSPAYWFPF
jgi:hypothetical protein